MNRWNLDKPGEAFASEARFTRDCRSAYKRITGEHLDWRGHRRSQVKE